MAARRAYKLNRRNGETEKRGGGVASGGGRRQLRDSLKYSGLGTLGPSLQAPERPQERTDAVGESVD